MMHWAELLELPDESLVRDTKGNWWRKFGVKFSRDNRENRPATKAGELYPPSQENYIDYIELDLNQMAEIAHSIVRYGNVQISY